MSYKLCPDCMQPILRKGQKRKHPDDYRHATGCRYAKGKYYADMARLLNKKPGQQVRA